MIKMKIAVIYKSFLGSTGKYAEWLSEEINADVFKFGQIKKDQFDNYDIVIISSGTYIGWMPLKGYLKKVWQYIKDKNVVVVAVGAAPEDDEWSIKSYERIPIDIRSKIKYFKIPGKLGKQTAKDIKKENLESIFKYIRSL